jgi:hypothetical protein
MESHSIEWRMSMADLKYTAQNIVKCMNDVINEIESEKAVGLEQAYTSIDDIIYVLEELKKEIRSEYTDRTGDEI